ncbi:MAG: hypothetical protein V3V67_17870 [Myxococcota bacterium]
MPPSSIPRSFRRLRHARPFELDLDEIEKRERRIRRIISSIQRDVDEGGRAYVRQILRGPLELYRIELERPEMSYQRTTIVDRATLELLLEQTPEETVRASFSFASPA